MGEVVIADNTVTGVGCRVLAQRVEQLADPGGVCITAALHETLPKRMPFDLENLGEQVLKGFDDPVRLDIIYRVELSAGQSVPAPQQASSTQSIVQRRSIFNSRRLIVIALLVVGGTYYSLKVTGTSRRTGIHRAHGLSVTRQAFDRRACPLPT